MRVAIVCPYDLGKHGGVQDQVIRLSRWLDGLGHDPTIIGAGTDGPDGAVLLGGSISVRANMASTPIAIDPRVAKRLNEAVQDADVVHIHEPMMPVVSTTATRIANLPTVGTFHADPPRWARFGYRAGSGLMRKLVGRLDVITTVSHVSASAIEPFAQPLIIPNGIDISDYGREEKVANSVVFLGRDDERKGLRVLLEAWPAVMDQFPDAQLRVVGADREETWPGVVFLGRVSEAEKIRELATADIYCAPNLGGESFGIVVAEGMASRCAVVASAIPAFVSVLAGSGELVAPGDSAALGDRIVSLLRDREHLLQRQRETREAVGRFDGEIVAAQYVSAYEEAVVSHSR